MRNRKFTIDFKISPSILGGREDIKIVYFHRKRGPGHYSIERVFSNVRKHLSDGMKPVVAECRRESKGILNRIINIMWATQKQGDINHITGDIHYLALFLKKKKTILTIHDCNVLRRYKGIKKFLLWLFWYRIPVARCQIITAISEFTKQEIINYLKCSPSKIKVIPDPYGHEFKPYPKSLNRISPVILQLGTGWNKNLERVAQALRGISCQLMIIGHLSDMQKKLLSDNSITYENRVGVSDEELVLLYQKCDLVIFASIYEGFGLPIIEANAIGRPVVTSNIPPMSEVAGDAGCLVNPFDVESIRAGILRVIHDEKYREQLIQNGFKNAQKYRPETIAKQYGELYKELLNYKEQLF